VDLERRVGPGVWRLDPAASVGTDCKRLASPRRHDGAMTSPASPGPADQLGRTVADLVAGFRQAIESGLGGDLADLYAVDAVADLTVPNWRYTAEGRAKIGETYAGWFAHLGSFEEVRVLPTPDGVVGVYTVTWAESGMPHAAHLIVVTSSTSTMARSSAIPSSAVVAGRPRCSPRWRMPPVSAEASAPARHVHDNVDDLLAGAQRLGAFTPPGARSRARFERVVVDGQRCVVKYIHPDHDFALRAMGESAAIGLRVWRLGLMDTAPHAIDHATLGVARWGHDGRGWALLMRDVSDSLVPAGDGPIAEEAHLALLEDLAAFSVANWHFRDTFGLLPGPLRWQFFGPAALAVEESLGFPEPVPRLAVEGWLRFAERAPAAVVDAVESLRRDATAIGAALAGTPDTLLHGDWKLGNLGRANGRTVLIDWVYVGAGPVAHELAWYLALNRARLPRGSTKESTIDSFRAALVRRGVDPSGWWDRQLHVCLLGALVQFGWEKALGPDDELAWWCDRAAAGIARL